MIIDFEKPTYDKLLESAKAENLSVKGLITKLVKEHIAQIDSDQEEYNDSSNNAGFKK